MPLLAPHGGDGIARHGPEGFAFPATGALAVGRQIATGFGRSTQGDFAKMSPPEPLHRQFDLNSQGCGRPELIKAAASRRAAQADGAPGEGASQPVISAYEARSARCSFHTLRRLIEAAGERLRETLRQEASRGCPTAGGSGRARAELVFSWPMRSPPHTCGHGHLRALSGSYRGWQRPPSLRTRCSPSQAPLRKIPRNAFGGQPWRIHLDIDLNIFVRGTDRFWQSPRLGRAWRCDGRPDGRVGTPRRTGHVFSGRGTDRFSPTRPVPRCGRVNTPRRAALPFHHPSSLRSTSSCAKVIFDRRTGSTSTPSSGRHRNRH